jgi:uncharacterized protein
MRCGIHFIWTRSGQTAALTLALFLLPGCSPQRFFYYPNKVLFADPDRMHVKNEIVHYPSLNGKTLYGVYFPTDQTPKGTIVHFHGNFGNLSNHFPLALFLTKHGFDVLCFDYEGYGASEGRPNAKNLVDDGLASVRYAQSRLRTPGTGVAVFGQSLGGAVAVVVTAKEPLVRGAVIESAFARYRTMARVAMGRHWITWILYPAVPFVSRHYDPVDFVAHIAPRPVLFIHGDADTIVPTFMSRTLFDAAREPKSLWIIPGAGHLEGRRKAGAEYEKKISEFFEAALKPHS